MNYTQGSREQYVCLLSKYAGVLVPIGTDPLSFPDQKSRDPDGGCWLEFLPGLHLAPGAPGVASLTR